MWNWHMAWKLLRSYGVFFDRHCISASANDPKDIPLGCRDHKEVTFVNTNRIWLLLEVIFYGMEKV